MGFKNYPNLDPLYNELRDFIKEHQGEKGYIETQDNDCDTIYTLVYREDEFRAIDAKVHGVRVKNDKIQIAWADMPLHENIVFTEEDYKDESNWFDLRYDECVYYVHTLFYIADFIEEYI